MAAQELLQKVREGAKLGSVRLDDVEEILSNEDFTSGEGLLTTTRSDNQVSSLQAWLVPCGFKLTVTF